MTAGCVVRTSHRQGPLPAFEWLTLSVSAPVVISALARDETDCWYYVYRPWSSRAPIASAMRVHALSGPFE